MASLDRPEKMTLLQAFNSFCRFGMRDKQATKVCRVFFLLFCLYCLLQTSFFLKKKNKTQNKQCEMDVHRFVKLCKQSSIIETGRLSQADIEILFMKMAPRVPKKITYATFRDKAIPLLAEISKSTVEETANKVRYSGGPTATEALSPIYTSREGSSENLRRQSSGSGSGEKSSATETPLNTSIRRGYAGVRSFNSSVKSTLNSSVKSVTSDTPFTLIGGQTMGFIPSRGSDGFTVVSGMDVTCGRILTSDLRNKDIADTKPVVGGFAPDVEYKRIWRQKRAARGLATESAIAQTFSSGFTDLRSVMGDLNIEDDGEDF